MTLEDCIGLLSKIGEIKLEGAAARVAFSDSKMTLIDTMKNPINNTKLSFTEFLVFLCRVAHENPKGEDMNEKINQMLPIMLKPYGLTLESIQGEKNEEEK